MQRSIYVKCEIYNKKIVRRLFTVHNNVTSSNLKHISLMITFESYIRMIQFAW